MLLAGKYQATKLMSDKGSFGDTYEITERGIPKVLKVLKSNKAKAIELFDREYRVLSGLTGENIAGIPRVEDFFLYAPKSQHTLHCIVMEKINGLDLEEYIQQRKQAIDEKTAMNWLSQLTKILKEIHDRGIFHRDIKPSNVILQPDGQLALIDFGAVKEAAMVNIKTGQVHTQIYTPGYAAPEQQQTGGATAQSDFYALGRTFVYLLTEKRPTELYNAPRDLLIWRDQTNGISDNFLDLIDWLMNKDFNQRPSSTKPILQEIAASKLVSSGYQKEQVPKDLSPPPPPPPVALKADVATESSTIIPKTKSTILSLFSQKLLLSVIVLSSLLAFVTWLLFQKPPSPTPTSAKVGSNPSGVGEGDTFATVPDVPTGVFKFGGSTSWATTRQPQSSIDAAIQGVFPKYDIDYTDTSTAEAKSVQEGRCDKQPGSNTGICWLIEGDLDFAQTSVPLSKTKYADRAVEVKLVEKAVAYDALTVVVNPQLKISGLTISQLRNIYTGKITNWSKVGGPDLPILTFARSEKADGTVTAFKAFILQAEDQWNPNQIVSNTTEGLQQVKLSPNGIYFGAAKEVMTDFCGVRPLAIGSNENDLVKPYLEPLSLAETCSKGKRNQINPAVIKNQLYPLTRKIYVVIKADGSDRQKAGEAYANLLMTQQGQNLLEKSGFVSIK
jgi:serine/threonine protein kinase